MPGTPFKFISVAPHFSGVTMSRPTEFVLCVVAGAVLLALASVVSIHVVGRGLEWVLR